VPHLIIRQAITDRWTPARDTSYMNQRQYG